MVVCWGRGRQAAGVGGMRRLAGWGGVIYQSEQIRVELLSGTEHEHITVPLFRQDVPELAGREGDQGVPSNRE